MNEALASLARELELDSPSNERLRLEFGHGCALRVKHLLEDPAVVQCLSKLGQYLEGAISEYGRQQASAEASRLANQHHGSPSIDGCGHAAVSATYAVANALAGKAIQAADYAAYATVYGQGGYGAVANHESFQPEFAWQVGYLSSLVHQYQLGAEPSSSGTASTCL
jgi:hypothetical protein